MEKKMPQNQSQPKEKMNQSHYPKLLIMGVLSFLSMYILMYSMVNKFADVHNNLNEFYMAMIMTAPMMILELLLMGSMYPNKKLNVIILAGSVAALVIFYLFVRQQTAITDKQFLQSMIPHHSSAILMCENAAITDPEIQALCDSIVEGQQSEIDQMEAILERLNQ
jgi:uncharacterized protein (DUF305 family)